MLYLLALIQLVGGPLVLLQVTLFCKLTLREAPALGIADSVVKAWKSDAFQQALITGHPRTKDNQSPLPSHDPPTKLEKAKSPPMLWKPDAPLITAACVRWTMITRERIWTPAWPQAPPGPPPRLG